MENKDQADVKIKVLLIDDQPDVLEPYRLKLVLDGREVLTAQSGLEGLELAAKEQPDLIFLDINMPDLDGFEVLERLKGDENLKHLPVVILSNLDDEVMVERGLALGAKEYLLKSNFPPSKLSAKLQEYFA